MRKLMLILISAAAIVGSAVHAGDCGCGGGRCCCQPYLNVARVQVTQVGYVNPYDTNAGRWPKQVVVTTGWNMYANNTALSHNGEYGQYTFTVYHTTPTGDHIDYRDANRVIAIDPVNNPYPCWNCASYQVTGTNTLNFTQGTIYYHIGTTGQNLTPLYIMKETADYPVPAGTNDYISGTLSL